MQKLFALIAISIILSQAYAQTACPSSLIGWYSTQSTTAVAGCTQCNSNTTITCSSGVIALSCQQGYQNINQVCTPCSIDFSNQCQSTCTSQFGGVISVGQTCLSCLNSTTKCNSACKGFYSSGNSCVKCPKGTLECSSATLATACNSNYYLGPGGVCTQCPTGMSQCKSTSVATQCAQGYYLAAATSTSTAQCKQCAESKVANCQPECLNAGFYGNATSCTACATSSSQSCNSACLNFGFTSTTSSSTPTTQGCIACNDKNTLKCNVKDGTTSPIQATACTTGYYLGSSDQNGVSMCLTCAGVSVNQWQTLQAQSSCTPQVVAVTCNNGYFVNQTSCTSCQSLTSQCQTPCLKTGYFNNNQTCSACTEGGSQCSNATTHTSCFSGYTLIGPTCTQNSQISSGVTNSANPLSTDTLPGYYLNSDSIPTLCQTGQKTCSAATALSNKITIALSCMTGYSLFNNAGVCVKVASGIAGGVSPLPTSCSESYYLASDSNGVKCTICSGNTKTNGCYNGDSGKATGCKTKAYLDANGVCQDCTETTNTLLCVALGSSAGKATYCIGGQYSALPYNGCSALSGSLVNSADYSAASSTKVSACSQGYFLSVDGSSNSVCTQCGFFAKECTSANVIKSCQTNYLATTISGQIYCMALNKYGVTGTTATNYAFQPTQITCTAGSISDPEANVQGYWYDYNTFQCRTCQSSSQFTNAAKITLGKDQIKICSVDNLNNLITYTCTTGYTTFSQASGNFGCVSCAGIEAASRILAAGDNNAATGYVSCTAPTGKTGVTSTDYPTSSMTNTICKSGYVLGKKTANLNKCLACATFSFDNIASFAKGQDQIKTCASASSSSTSADNIDISSLTAFTCNTAYTQASISGSKYGCVSCGGLTTSRLLQDGRILAANDNAAVTGYTSCTAPTGISAFTNANFQPSTITNVICASGYILSKITATLNTCVACATYSFTNLAQFTKGQDAIATCSLTSDSSTTADNLDLTTYTCKTGYTKAVITDNGSKYGCVSCGGLTTSRLLQDGRILAANDNAAVLGYTSCTAPTGKTAFTNANFNLLFTSVSCSTGYVLSKITQTLNTCVDCATYSFTNLASFTKGQDAIATCSLTSDSSTTADNLDLTTYTCKTGYTKAMITTGSKYGCVSCGGLEAPVRILAAGDNNAATGYVSCTAPTGKSAWSSTNFNLQFTSVSCSTGYVLSKITATLNTCQACATYSFTNLASFTKGQDAIATCSLTSDSSTTADNLDLTTYTCKTGYTKAVITDSGNKYGCVSCGGLTTSRLLQDGRILAANDNAAVTGYTSCTAPTGKTAFTNANFQPSTMTGTVCVTGSLPSTQGYFLHSDKTCKACNLQASFASNTALTQPATNGLKILICSVTSDILQTGYTCNQGYTSLVYGSTPQGCISCAGLTGDNAQQGVTGYVSCSAVTTNSALTVAQWMRSAGKLGGISNLKCDTGYAQTDVYTCTQIDANAVIVTTAIPSTKGCADKYFYSTTTGKCVLCTQTGVATCSSNTATDVLSCTAQYYFALGKCIPCQDDGSGGLATGVETCDGTKAYASSCISGYAKIGGQCILCPSNSNSCVGLAATNCVAGYYVLSGECKVCSDVNAQLCPSAKATSCKQGLTAGNNFYLKASTSVCTPCSDTKALTCDTSGVTVLCISGYFKDSSNACATCTGANIISCSASNVATSGGCKSGYGGADCSTECIAGGLTCSTSTVALSCLSGYYNNNAATYNCIACGQNVAKCTDINNAQSCNSGYFLDTNKKCVQCPQAAITCTSTFSATSCLSGYTQSPVNGACLKCADSNTINCAGTYVGSSDTCASNYFKSNGQCSSCGAGALTCDSTAKHNSCLDNYYLVSNQCTQCIQSNAKVCASASVTSCLSGYFVASDKNSCSACPQNADTCTDEKTVGVCKSGFQQITDSSNVIQCIQCAANQATCTSTTDAKTCNDGYTVLGKTCIACLVGAKTCNQPSLTCQNGFTSIGGLCVSCSSTTQSCQGTCTTQGYYSDTAACTQCDPFATACSSAKAAQTCQTGYFVSSSSTCTQCATGVSDCTDANTYKQCSIGYFPDANPPTKCTSCGTGAYTCISATQASVCQDTYYLGNDGKCAQCTGTNLKTCQLAGYAVTCSSGSYPLNGVCLSCIDPSNQCNQQCLSLGFFSDSNSCKACSSNALSCQSASQALTCNSGYYLNNLAACVACASNTLQCNLAVSNPVADIGYVLVNGNIVACPANFATCSSATNGTACLSGFYLSTSWTTCTICPSPSSTCTNATTFQSCLDGYYAVALGGQDVNCVACPSTANVITCYNSTYATKCSAGFSAVNGSCSQCPSNAASCNGNLILQCKEGYYIANQYLAANNTCNACGSGAATCQNNTLALTCLPGYGLNNGTCNRCGTGASSCTGSTIVCFASFTLSGGVCSCAAGQGPSADGQSCGSCPANCATCSSQTACTSCNTLFQLNGTSCSSQCAANQFYSTSTASKRILQACVDCPKGCASCTSASQCTTCSSGFSLSGSACNTNFAGKLIGNIFLIIALLALIIKQ